MSPASGPAAGGGATRDRRWRDGSEDLLVEVLAGATDRSTASDELAAHVVDWPTRYHFDRARTNLLHPLGLDAGLRVLDVGAGSGVEGDARRAEAARLRCAGLDVEVVHGTVSDLDGDRDGFDVVLCIGVLEYAGDDPAAFLDGLAGRLAPDGVLVVAIENRFGLAYWLGADEDHLARPWVGLEGYPARAAGPTTATVRTHGRRDLAALLDGAGLAAQRWLTSWPDYKLPTAILSDRIHDQPDAVDLVDQLVGPPLDRSRMGGGFDGDERAVLRGTLEASAWRWPTRSSSWPGGRPTPSTGVATRRCWPGDSPATDGRPTCGSARCARPVATMRGTAPSTAGPPIRTRRPPGPEGGSGSDRPTGRPSGT